MIDVTYNSQLQTEYFQGTVAVFNGVKLIVMHRCTASLNLNYGSTEARENMVAYDTQTASCCSCHMKATHRWNYEQKAPDAGPLCGRHCDLPMIVPSKCGCNFLTGSIALAPPNFTDYRWLLVLTDSLRLVTILIFSWNPDKKYSWFSQSSWEVPEKFRRSPWGTSEEL